MENSTPKINGKNQYPVAEKKESLATAERIGVKQAAEQYQVSMHSIYNWSHAYQEKGDAGLQDLRCHNPGGKPVPDWKRQKVLAVRDSDRVGVMASVRFAINSGGKAQPSASNRFV